MELMRPIRTAWPLVLCGALLAPAAPSSNARTPEITWKERYYNPAPNPDDLVLPMPCGGAMVFRPVATPHGSRSLDDRAIELGDESPEYNFLRGRRHEYVSGPFTLADGQTQGYYLGKYEVAIAQYDAVMAGTCPDKPPRRADFIAKSELSWFDAVAFTRTYSEWLMREAREAMPEVEGVPAFVRLPTESEWEYATRGGAMVDPGRFREPHFPMTGSTMTAFAATGDAESANGRIQPIGTLAAAGSLVLSLGGCAGTGSFNGLVSDGDRTAEEVALLDSSDDITTRSTLQGAGLGAAVGCGLGFAIGSDFEDCLYGMLCGAALGAGAGYAVGANNAAAAQAEYDEQAMITVLAEQEKDLKQVEDNLNVVLADQRRRLETLNTELAANEISEAEYREQYNSMMAVRKQVAEDLAAEKENREQFAIQVAAWQNQGIDTTPVAAKNAENLQKIERLIKLASQVEPAAA